jgi:intracellular sulfur oxidation DsrE/DsrF family protein
MVEAARAVQDSLPIVCKEKIMSFKSILASIMFLAASILMTGFSVARAADVKKDHHLVFQVLDDDPAKWMHALGIANNVQQLLGKEHMAIEIVVHSGGINMVMKDSAIDNKICAAQQEGIVFAACAQTMKRDHMTEKDLHDGVKVVPIGVVEIMQKEEEGWSYIRL